MSSSLYPDTGEGHANAMLDELRAGGGIFQFGVAILLLCVYLSPLYPFLAYGVLLGSCSFHVSNTTAALSYNPTPAPPSSNCQTGIVTLSILGKVAWLALVFSTIFESCKSCVCSLFVSRTIFWLCLLSAWAGDIYTAIQGAEYAVIITELVISGVALCCGFQSWWMVKHGYPSTVNDDYPLVQV